jgi:hypothetical protein
MGTQRKEEPVPSRGVFTAQRVVWLVTGQDGEVPVVLQPREEPSVLL